MAIYICNIHHSFSSISICRLYSTHPCCTHMKNRKSGITCSIHWRSNGNGSWNTTPNKSSQTPYYSNDADKGLHASIDVAIRVILYPSHLEAPTKTGREVGGNESHFRLTPVAGRIYATNTNHRIVLLTNQDGSVLTRSEPSNKAFSCTSARSFARICFFVLPFLPLWPLAMGGGCLH